MMARLSERWSTMVASLTAWARQLKAEIAVIASAARDPRTPWPAKLLALAVVAYAVSPIDLIPDFIPVLGLLDDAVLLPLGLMAIKRLIPIEVLADHRAKVALGARLPASRRAAAVVVALWLVGAVAIVVWIVD